MPRDTLDSLRQYARIATLALLTLGTTAVMTGGSHLAYSQETTPGEASGSGDGTGDATGSDSASAGMDGTAGVEVNAAPNGDTTATGNANTTANATQTSGGDTTSADTNTNTVANASKIGNVFSADATANAEGNSSPGGTTGKQTATADATYGNGAPTANAKTLEDGSMTTEAQVVHGQTATASCSGACTKQVEKVGSKKTVALAIFENAMSLAVTTKKGAFAKSGVFSDFTYADAKYGGKAVVSAFAKATGTYARSGASASAWSGGGENGAWARASSNAHAKACVGDCRPPAPKVALACDWEWKEVGVFRVPYCAGWKK